jgi:hypothetical protein
LETTNEDADIYWKVDLNVHPPHRISDHPGLIGLWRKFGKSPFLRKNLDKARKEDKEESYQRQTGGQDNLRK